MRTRGRPTWPLTQATLRLAPALLLALLTGFGSACGTVDTAVTEFDGYWEVGSSNGIAPYRLFRITWTEAGYLVEPSSSQGVSWSLARKESDALVADATGPAGDEYVVRFRTDPENSTLSMTITGAQDGAAPIMEASLRRPEGIDSYIDQAFESELAEWRVETVSEGVRAIELGIQAWMADHDGQAPPRAAVWPYAELGRYVDVWPQNPYEDRVMLPGDGRGDYAYRRIDDGRGYWLKGHLPGGQSFVVP